ncbi:MAG: hypothetical protein JWN04_6639 [Myxococcaceae bacterium]|nr:hypothetical protein [Myxococcaceae bacterium]
MRRSRKTAEELRESPKFNKRPEHEQLHAERRAGRRATIRGYGRPAPSQLRHFQYLSGWDGHDVYIHDDIGRDFETHKLRDRDLVVFQVHCERRLDAQAGLAAG